MQVHIRASLRQPLTLAVNKSELASLQLWDNHREPGKRDISCPLVREWLWHHCQNELLQALSFELQDEEINEQQGGGEAKEEETTEKEVETEAAAKSTKPEDSNVHGNVPPLEQHPLDRCPFTGITISDCPPFHPHQPQNGDNDASSCPATSPPAPRHDPNEIAAAIMTENRSQAEMDLEKATLRLRLLDKIAQVQRQYLQMEDQKVVFGCLLTGLLELMDSEYGFIGEVKYGDPADPSTIYLQTHAITNIAWDAATRAFYRDNIESGLRFTNVNSLFGAVMMTQQPVISNSPATDPRRCGIPAGHPPLKKFLGIPFFQKGHMNGMVGIANKPGGYSEADINLLEPFVVTCSNLIQAYWQVQQNKHLINTLEEKVAARTLALEAANEKIVRTSAAQLQHFACMSHEIRTPLNCIIGLSSLLQETELNPMQSESLKMVTSSSELLLTVVNDVLDYSKLESGNVEVTLRWSSLQEALIGVVHSIEMKSRGKNIAVKTFYDPYVPEYWNMDPLRLQQILFNLLGNAYKFSPTNNSIHLSVQLGKPESAEFTAVHDQVLRFSVKDHGCGIKEENLTSIFQPFVQVGTDDDKLFEGTGLGLAITSKLVKAMGGAVYATSDEGKWSEFHVELPFVFTPDPELVAMDILDKNEGESMDNVEIVAPVDPAPNRPADVEGMSKRFSNNTVLLVHSSARDYETSESLPHIERILEAYHVDFFILKNMTELDEFQLGTTSSSSLPATERPRLVDPSRCYICLADECLYEQEPFERLSSKVSTILLTFGEEFRVSETAGHFRNLLHVLPSVLMQSMIEAVEDAAIAPISEEDVVSDEKPPERRTSIHSLNDPTDFNGQIRNHNMLKPVNNQRLSLQVRPREEVSILVAEDNVINQKVLVALLKKVGFTKVNVVGDGQLAVNAVTQGHYDIVLMDVQMPVMDGLEATRLIVQRKREKMMLHQGRKEEMGGPGNVSAGPRIVFVTATVEQKLQEEAAALGAVGFVPKPFNLRQLEKCLADICESLD